MRRDAGIYILLVAMQADAEISVGQRGPYFFPRGLYLYVGSALGGLEARIARHRSWDKKHHWHIDYLLSRGEVDGVLTIPTQERLECRVARLLERRFEAVPRFGASDCRCGSHLFFSPEGDAAWLLSQLRSTIEKELRIPANTAAG